MVSECKLCGAENVTFIATGKRENWFECSDCGGKSTQQGMNHKYSPEIPLDAKIEHYREDEHEQEIDEYTEKRVFDSKVKKAHRIAEAEEELQDEIIERKKSLIEQQELRREVTDYFVEDEEYEDEEEALDIYEPSFTEELAKLLRVYQIKKVARQTIIQQSKRLEAEGEFVHPNDLKEKLVAIAKINEKVSNIIMKDYQDLIHRFEGHVDDYPSSPRRTRDYDRGYRRDKPQPMNIQDFIQMEREKEAREAIQNQIADKDYNIQIIMQEKQKLDEKVERIEEEMKELKRDHKEEIREYQREVKALEKELFDSKIAEVRVQATQSFSTDATKLLDKAIDKNVLSKALSTLTDMNRPLPPTKSSQLPPPEPQQKIQIQRRPENVVTEIDEADAILSAFDEEDIID